MLFRYDVSRIQVSRKPQYQDVYWRVIEGPQRARMFKVHWFLQVHNAYLKLVLPILG